MSAQPPGDPLSRDDLCRLWAARAARVNFSAQHRDFIAAVCDEGKGTFEAARSVAADPEVAENLERMMLEIARNERAFELASRRDVNVEE